MVEMSSCQMVPYLIVGLKKPVCGPKCPVFEWSAKSSDFTKFGLPLIEYQTPILPVFRWIQYSGVWYSDGYCFNLNLNFLSATPKLKKIDKKHKASLELSPIFNFFVDSFVNSVQDDGHGAHQRRLQNRRVTFLKKYDRFTTCGINRCFFS